MKTISLRKFRTEVVEIREEVEVMRRDREGNIAVLGRWVPYMTHPAGSVAVPEPDDRSGEFPVGSDEEFDLHPRTAPRIIKTPEEAATVVPISPIRAVPKPSQRRKSR